MIKIDEVKQRILSIEYTAKRDDEGAHSMEDDLYAEVLIAISEGSEEAVELAMLALTTRSINFNRWCA